jgi:large subunit ribosomal protein L18
MGNVLSGKKRIKYRIRKRLSGTADKPRLAVYKSNKYIYCQIVDDVNGVTLASASSRTVDNGGNIESAKAVGQAIAEKAKSQNLSEVVFDRGGVIYHGRVKALAEAAREAGLQF